MKMSKSQPPPPGIQHGGQIAKILDIRDKTKKRKYKRSKGRGINKKIAGFK